jgi:GNAT superfamily N-acetyltransferase
MVEDGWQSRGVGKLLLSELSEAARRRSVEVFVCYSLVENRKAQEFVSSMFVGARFENREGLRLVRVPLKNQTPYAKDHRS